MKIFSAIFLVLLFFVYFVSIEYILFKGKQYNRYFATLLNVSMPVMGSVLAYIMACKYEKRILAKDTKINNIMVKSVMSGMQLLSVIMLFLPLFSFHSGSISGFNLIMGSSDAGFTLKPMIFLSYIIIFPLVSTVLNYVLRKTNVSNFLAYGSSLLNIITVFLMGVVFKTKGSVVSAWAMLFCFLNLCVMFTSLVSMVCHRDRCLYMLEYREKVEYVKEQQKKKETEDEVKPDSNTYKCAKCGKYVKKGTICSCIEQKPVVSPKADADGKKENPASFCVYCKKALSEGESCNCQGEGFGIVVKSETQEKPKNRKCIYCGQLLVGESTCVCEKIMKNSAPADSSQEDTESKAYFKSQVEKSSNAISDELAELEKKINSRFESVKESMYSHSDN